MDAFRITGGVAIEGSVTASGSKNASLPILAAALLTESECTVQNVPGLLDVTTMCRLLTLLGCDVWVQAGTIRLQPKGVDRQEAPYDLVRTMRASIVVLGPLLARFGKARVSLPGGCALGARPVDQHLLGLQAMGATVAIEHGYIEAVASHGLRGADFRLAMPSVTGSMNLMMAACLAQGTTWLRNAACEPEVAEVGRVLSAMGARVSGAGTDIIQIEGQATLGGFQHTVSEDRIEVGTLLIAGAMSAARLHVRTQAFGQHAALLTVLRAAGVHVEERADGYIVRRPERLLPVDVETAPFPGYATDMQAQLMAMLCLASGTSSIHEQIFESRFMHAAELGRMGAHIQIDGARAQIHGVARLSGATVMATDLRASAALVLAGLVADGETIVRRIYHLDRGYFALEKRLAACGARIERFRE